MLTPCAPRALPDRSGLNQIPLIEWFRRHPDDLSCLEVAVGAMSGQLANIDASGANPNPNPNPNPNLTLTLALTLTLNLTLTLTLALTLALTLPLP